MSFEMSAAAFHDRGAIPERFTCDGKDISPALAWSAPPTGTTSLALVVDDPDGPAGMWVHWVLYDLPGGLRKLSENLPKNRDLANGARQGRNDFGKIGYNGPCPPRGPAHRYFFKLYGLSSMTHLESGATKAELESAMRGKILAQAQLIGTFQR